MSRRNTKLQVELFPFLSVLCGTIGVMVLLLSMVLGTSAADAVEEADAQPPVPQKPPHKPGEKEEGIDEQTFEEFQKQLAELNRELTDRLQQRGQLHQRLQDLLVLLREKEDALELPELALNPHPVRLDERELVIPIPDESRKIDKRPVFLEVSAEGYLLQPAKTRFPPITSKKMPQENTNANIKSKDGQEQFVADPEFRKFLERLDQRRSQEYLLLLIHPNGSESYLALRRYLQQDFSDERRQQLDALRVLVRRVIRFGIGVEPFSRDWEFISQSAPP